MKPTGFNMLMFALAWIGLVIGLITVINYVASLM